MECSNGGWTPAGIILDTITFNGITYDYYQMIQKDQSGVNPYQWNLSIFAARQPILNGPLVLSDFINYLMGDTVKILLNDSYITSFELGNEIVEGTESAEISNFSIEIK